MNVNYWGWVAFGIMFLLWLLKGERRSRVRSHKFPEVKSNSPRPSGAISPYHHDHMKSVTELPTPEGEDVFANDYSAPFVKKPKTTRRDKDVIPENETKTRHT